MRAVRLVLGAVLCLTAYAADSPIVIDYPADQSIFPPDFAAPTFLFRDPDPANESWQVEVTFSNGAPPLRLTIKGERLQVGAIDERAIADTNELPKLSAQQEATRTWVPDASTWSAIRKNSVDAPATVTFAGKTGRGSVRLSTSKDPVGAPVFFRDVPLMPSQLEKGVIRPIPKAALPLIAWRLRYMDETESRLLIDGMPTCANCHSFSADGKTLGMDLDGPANDKGLYALVPIKRDTTIRNEDVIAWSSFKGKLGGKLRVGFMSQVSPDGRHVVTMVNGNDVAKPSPGAGLPKDVGGNFYVANFKDYRFLQVFYPTRGVLAWYSRESGKLQPLPGADDPEYVHTNATWSPDGKYLVFARAKASDPYADGARLAEKANDAAETQVRYDLYRIPFNDGRGGTPEPIAGASANGMSNSFAKISPDGRWIVYVQARNGLLMRPDSQLYIVPAAGGKPRRLKANTPLMNSWHSFSPNGRWLVFSSKSRSPYTQMFLTHIDENGDDSPAILVENATAANRAVNIPEFVNVAKDAWATIDAPATEFYRMLDNALELTQKRRYEESIAEYRRALAMEPNDTTALNNLAVVLITVGAFDEATDELKKALAQDPDNFKAYSNLGVALARSGRLPEAEEPLRRALAVNTDDAKTHSTLGGVLANTGRMDEAIPHLEKALSLDPVDADAHNNLGSLRARAGQFDQAITHFEKGLEAEPNSAVLHFNLGRALAAAGRTAEGIVKVERAVQMTGGMEPMMLDRLADLYVSAGRSQDALGTLKRAVEAATQRGDQAAAGELTRKLEALQSR